MKKNKTILLGVKNNEIVTADLELRNWNGYEEFSCCFNVGEAFNIEEVNEDYKQNYFEELWDCYNAEQKIDLLDDGEKTKEEVFNDWNYYIYDGYKEFIDCSCTDYETEFEGKIINFRSVCGGQHDVRKDGDFQNMKFTSKKVFNKIMYLWDNYHCKEVKGEELEEINALLNNNNLFEEWGEEFNNFIIKNIDWSVL